MSATMPTVVAAPIAAPNRAARLVAQIRSLEQAEIVERIRSAREMTDDELIARQVAERQARAEAAVARLNAR